jgi:hypothetical protein
MKKLFTVVLLAPLAALSQVNLDTVYVRSTTLQAQEWLYMTGKYTTRADSLVLKGFRRIRARAQEVAPVSLTTNVTIDSIPGIVLVEMYRIVKNAPAGEIAARYTQITNAISAKTVLSSFLAVIDASADADFLRARKLGQYDLLDL